MLYLVHTYKTKTSKSISHNFVPLSLNINLFLIHFFLSLFLTPKNSVTSTKISNTFNKYDKKFVKMGEKKNFHL